MAQKPEHSQMGRGSLAKNEHSGRLTATLGLPAVFRNGGLTIANLRSWLPVGRIVRSGLQLRHCLENPFSPEVRCEFGFAGNIRSEAGCLVVPIDALHGLDPVPAQNSNVRLDPLAWRNL